MEVWQCATLSLSSCPGSGPRSLRLESGLHNLVLPARAVVHPSAATAATATLPRRWRRSNVHRRRCYVVQEMASATCAASFRRWVATCPSDASAVPSRK